VSWVISSTRAPVAAVFGRVANRESEFVEILPLVRSIYVNGSLLVGIRWAFHHWMPSFMTMDRQPWATRSHVDFGLKNGCDDGWFAPGGFFFGLINVAVMWWRCEGAPLGSLGQ